MEMLFKRIARTLRNSRIARFERNINRARHQGGYVVIALAMIGLFGGAAAASPVLNRVISSLSASEVGPVNQSGASCAAEHALWRLENDPTLWGGMTGSPPSTTYQEPACSVLSNADITIEALDDPPTGDDRISVELTVTPDAVAPNTNAQFTYTLKVTNDDVQPHNLTRLVIDPLLFFWNPDAVAGSTTGVTTADPIETGCYFGFCRWQWDLASPVEVPAFGGEVSLSFTAEENRSFGAHWTGASARFDGIGTIDAVNSTRLWFRDSRRVLIEQFITPDAVEAGQSHIYDVTIRVTNLDSDPIEPWLIRAWTPEELDFVPGSAEWHGASQHDASLMESWWLQQFFTIFVHEFRKLYNFTIVNNTTINPGDSADLTYQVQGNLEPGVHYSRSSVLIDDEPQNLVWQNIVLSDDSTGETAPIEVTQGFTITATHEGVTVEVIGVITENGIEVLSWREL
jgi:hypothetical protein